MSSNWDGNLRCKCVVCSWNLYTDRHEPATRKIQISKIVCKVDYKNCINIKVVFSTSIQKYLVWSVGTNLTVRLKVNST